MAARKKSARKKSARKKTEVAPPLPMEEAIPSIAHRMVEAVSSAVRPSDPRPEAWRKALVAKGQDLPIPRECRPHLDDRFTGRDCIAQVKALMVIGKSADESAELILKAAMDKYRGEKHCNW